MKVRVIRPFIDKVTKKKHKTDEEIEVSSARAAEILKRGPFIEKISEKKTENKEEK